MLSIAVVGLFATAGAAQADIGVAGFWGNPTTSPGVTGGLFGTTNSGIAGVAVAPSGGDVYVVDRGNQRVQRFTASGEFVSAWGWDVVVGGSTGFEVCTVASSCKAGVAGAGAGQFSLPVGVAVSPTTGDVYVTEQTNRRVSQFTAAGVFVRAFGGDVGGAGVNVCTVTCVAGTAGAGAGRFGTGFAGFPAVGPDGRVFVPDQINRRINEYSASGVFAAAHGWDVDASGGSGGLETCVASCQAGVAGAGPGQFGTNSPARAAVGPDGSIYATDTVNGRLLRFDSSFSTAADFAAATLENEGAAADVAVDAAGHVYVNVSVAGGRNILEFDALGLLVARRLDGAGISIVAGIAVSASGRPYFTSRNGGQRVYYIDEVTPADATIDPVASPGTHAANLTGTVNPHGGVPATYRFEISDDDGERWTVVAPDADAGAATGDTPVASAVAGLEGNHEHRVRLVATKTFGGPVTVSNEIAFTTAEGPPESVATLPASPVRSTKARLNATANTNNIAGTYRFELGRTIAYGDELPEGGGAVDTGTAASLSRWATGLEPGTEYHYRVLVTNAHGTEAGADQVFRTADVAATPPPGRAYEMVTPPDKATRHGGTGAEFGRTEETNVMTGVPSVDGDSLLYSQIFGVLGNPGGALGADPTRFVRTPDGWKPQSLLDRPVYGSTYAAFPEVPGASADQSTLSMRMGYRAFPAQPAGTGGQAYVYNRFLGSSPDWTGTPGWEWWTDPVADVVSGARPVSLFTDDGRYVAIGGGNRGALGPADPSRGQAAGAAVYREDLGGGQRELVSECTGTGAGATLVPERVGTGAATDVIGTRTCEAGSVTSAKGASVGAGDDSFNLSRLTGSVSNAFSADGRRAFFLSPDPLVAPGTCATATGPATDCPPQLYVSQWDADGNRRVAWLSRSEIAGQQIGQLGAGVGYEGASRDGRRVFFRTNAPLVADDPNGGQSQTTGSASPLSWDLYEYTLPESVDDDPDDGTLTRISGGPGGTADPGVSVAPGPGVVRYYSDDGSRIYFVTTAPIAGADNSAPAGSGPANVAGGTLGNLATRNLYRYDATLSPAQRWKFVARIPFALSGLDGCASNFPNPGGAIGGQATAVEPKPVSCVFGHERTDGDGDVVTFQTSAPLTADDDDTAADVYVYDSASDRLSRATAPQGVPESAPYDCAVGSPCNGDLGRFATPTNTALRGLDGQRHLTVARDGTVVFESRQALVPGDRNGTRSDVYAWRDGDLELVSPGTSDDHAWVSGISESGRDIFFQTSQRISPWEIEDGDVDIYDARRGGGLPDPPPPAGDCQTSGTCHGGEQVPPEIAGASSSADTGGNRPEPKSPGTSHRLDLGKVSSATWRRLAAGRKVTVKAKVTGGGPVRARVTGQVDGHRRVLATVTRSVQRSTVTSVSLPLWLNRPTRKALAAGRRIKVSLTVTAPKARAQRVTTTLARKRG